MPRPLPLALCAAFVLAAVAFADGPTINDPQVKVIWHAAPAADRDCGCTTAIGMCVDGSPCDARCNGSCGSCCDGSCCNPNWSSVPCSPMSSTSPAPPLINPGPTAKATPKPVLTSTPVKSTTPESAGPPLEMPLPMPAGAPNWKSAPTGVDETPEPIPAPGTEYEPLPPPQKLEGKVVPEPVEVHDGGPAITSDVIASPCRYWFQGEYLLWWTKGSNLPPLITTGPATAAIPGALGQNGTTVLFGGDVDNSPLSGARFSGGTWLDAGQNFGVDGSFFFLAQRTKTFNSSGGLTVLAFPFVDATTGAESSLLVIGPPQTTTTSGRLPNPGITSCINSTTTTVGDPSGTAMASYTTRLQGDDINFLWNMTPGPRDGFNLYFLTGYRYLELHDELTLGSSVTTTGTATTFFNGVPPGLTGTFTAFDQRFDDFDTRNKFYGWQIGAHGGWDFGSFSIDMTAKLALGDTREEVSIFGSHSATFNGTTSFAGNSFAVSSQQAFLGGIYAQPSNIGKYSRDVFAVVPEVGLGVNYKITNWLRATLSYNFLYWSAVSRPADAINRNISPSAFTPTSFPLQACMSPLASPPPVTSPTFTFQNSNYFAQGLCVGLEFSF